MEEQPKTAPFVFDLSTTKCDNKLRDLLLKYKGIISMSGLSKITGINERQLSHYVQGVSKPRKAQEEKIIQGLKKLGEELTQLDFK